MTNPPLVGLFLPVQSKPFSALFQPQHHDLLLRHYLYQCISSLHGAAHYCQANPALVWWIICGLDHLHGFLSDDFAFRLLVCRLCGPQIVKASPSYFSLHRRFDIAHMAAHHCQRLLETSCRYGAFYPYFVTAVGNGRTSLFAFVHHGAAGTSLVCALLP